MDEGHLGYARSQRLLLYHRNDLYPRPLLSGTEALLGLERRFVPVAFQRYEVLGSQGTNMVDGKRRNLAKEAELEVEKILVHSLHKKREGVDTELLTTDWKSIVNDPEIQIVIEVMGGIEPAKSMIEEALGAGKHVVTANKDLMAEHGGELLDLAAAHGWVTG